MSQNNATTSDYKKLVDEERRSTDIMIVQWPTKSMFSKCPSCRAKNFTMIQKSYNKFRCLFVI